MALCPALAGWSGGSVLGTMTPGCLCIRSKICYGWERACEPIRLLSLMSHAKFRVCIADAALKTIDLDSYLYLRD